MQMAKLQGINPSESDAVYTNREVGLCRAQGEFYEIEFNIDRKIVRRKYSWEVMTRQNKSSRAGSINRRIHRNNSKYDV